MTQWAYMKGAHSTDGQAQKHVLKYTVEFQFMVKYILQDMSHVARSNLCMSAYRLRPFDEALQAPLDTNAQLLITIQSMHDRWCRPSHGRGAHEISHKAFCTDCTNKGLLVQWGLLIFLTSC